MKPSLENYIFLYQKSELAKMNVDTTFWEPHVLFAKIRREVSKNSIRIYWQNSLLLDVIREDIDGIESWSIFDSNSVFLGKWTSSEN